jgi:ABC-type phosphate transport system auxiliary subunit
MRACVLHESSYFYHVSAAFPTRLRGRTLRSDERIDDAMARIEKRFDEIDRRFDRLEAEIAELRREMHNQFIVTTGAILSLAGVVLATSL